MTPRYEAVLRELESNSEQWRAFESDAHCVTLAGPGSGKTKVLTAKMARLLRAEVRAPRGVACLTYNNECARELERRLTALGVADLPNTFIGTLHGFCLRHVLGPLAKVAGIDVPQPITLASESLQKELLDEAMSEVGVTVQGFRTAFDRFRRTAIDRIDGIDGWEVGDRGLTDVCCEYEKRLRARGRLDFDDAVLLAVRAVEASETVRRCLRARFPVLLVDEYQDLGVPLHRMVLTLCFGAGVRLFAVGDPDQSIYSFTGARPDLLKGLAARDDVETVELRLNYRSGRMIIAASEYALGEHRGYKAFRSDEGAVEITRCSGGLHAQVSHVVGNLIPAFLEQGDLRGDIAVLYPTQQEGDALEDGFVEGGVPFVRLDRGAGYRRTPLVRLLEDMAAWCCGGWREGRPALSSTLAKWKSITGSRSGVDLRAARASLVRFLFAHRDATGYSRDWLSAFDTQVFGVYLRPAMAADDDDQAAFGDLLSLTDVDGALEELEIGMFGGKSGSSNHVCLMNLHTSKGTEFNAVVLVGLDDGRMPNYRARSSAEIAEQRRLFFVGVSRARREVHLLYSGFTVNKYGRRFDNGPSPFLVELERRMELT